MKLVLCEQCYDIFKLTNFMRHCACGVTSGRYLDLEKAEVSSNGISLALDNNTLMTAIFRMRRLNRSSAGNADRNEYIEKASVHAWIRPNDGPGNPHTTVIKKSSL